MPNTKKALETLFTKDRDGNSSEYILAEYILIYLSSF
jgi:hypothetical protein